MRETLLSLLDSLSILHQFQMESASAVAAAAIIDEAKHEDAAPLEPMFGKLITMLMSSIVSLSVIYCYCLNVITLRLRTIG